MLKNCLFLSVAALLVGLSSPVWADALIYNNDSSNQAIKVECGSGYKETHVFRQNDGVNINKSDLKAAEYGCLVKLVGGNGINLYDGEEYAINNNRLERQK